ncbi:MAG: hydantoinase B/oxoprolinase family protein [Pseudomonadaceae bacterium]|nr:hydantoinase B/oxoprolinase family protein [Pseudomonadaceae bacterium]
MTSSTETMGGDGREPRQALPLQTQLMWDRLLSIVEEQAQVLMRTAFSPVVREAGDLSAGVFDVRGRMLAQAVTGTPGHVNAMAESVAKFLAVVPADDLEAGDALLTNDPWDGTGHLNDFTVVSPVFHNGELVALFASTSHIADVGGRGFGPDANDLFEEGMRIPIGYLFRAGAINAELMRLLLANVRDPTAAQGDLYSLAACNDAGARALVSMLGEFGQRNLEDLGDVIIERSRAAMVDCIRQVPNGVYSMTMLTDGYDEAVRLECTLTVADTRMTLDYAGSSAASDRGVNVPLPYTRAYSSFGIRCVVGGDIPNNAGSLSCIEVTAPEGCIVNALPPAPVSARHAIGQLLPDVVLGALGQALPDAVPAEGASTIWNPVLRGLGQDDFVINPIFNGGTGGRPGQHGLAATAFPSGVRTTPTEINEATSPLVIWKKAYRQDSGGDGEFRGGDGQDIEITHREGRAFVISTMFDRMRFAARGRFGGGDGAAGVLQVITGQSDTGLEEATDLPGKGRHVVPEGGRLVLRTPGGGGLGSP